MTRLSALGLGVSACLASASARTATPVLGAATIRIEEFRFVPAETSVTVGDTVRWSNRDAFRHTATADSGAWSSGELSQGQQFSHIASRPGRYSYHCAAHPVMRAVLVVRE